MLDRTDVLWREEPTPAPADHIGARRRADRADNRARTHRADRDRARMAREANRAWQGREAREGRPRVQPPTPARAEASRRRHDAPVDAARDERAAPPIEPGSTPRTGRARNAPPRNATSSPPSGRPASARRAPGSTAPRLHRARPRPCPTTATRTDRRGTTAAQGHNTAQGQTRTGPVGNA